MLEISRPLTITTQIQYSNGYVEHVIWGCNSYLIIQWNGLLSMETSSITVMLMMMITILLQSVVKMRGDGGAE